MKKSFLIMFESGKKEETQLGIDMALAASAFDISLSILFLNERSIFCVEENDILKKQILAWPWYDITQIYFSSEKSFVIPATRLSEKEIDELIQKQAIVLRY